MIAASTNTLTHHWISSQTRKIYIIHTDRALTLAHANLIIVLSRVHADPPPRLPALMIKPSSKSHSLDVGRSLIPFVFWWQDTSERWLHNQEESLENKAGWCVALASVAHALYPPFYGPKLWRCAFSQWSSDSSWLWRHHSLVSCYKKGIFSPHPKEEILKGSLMCGYTRNLCNTGGHLQVPEGWK